MHRPPDEAPNSYGYIDCVITPGCGSYEYRPLDGSVDPAYGYVVCLTIPDCDSGWYRPEEGAVDTAGLIPCVEIACNEGLYYDHNIGDCALIPDCDDGWVRPPDGEVDESVGYIQCIEIPQCDETEY